MHCIVSGGGGGGTDKPLACTGYPRSLEMPLWCRRNRYVATYAGFLLMRRRRVADWRIVLIVCLSPGLLTVFALFAFQHSNDSLAARAPLGTGDNPIVCSHPKRKSCYLSLGNPTLCFVDRPKNLHVGGGRVQKTISAWNKEPLKAV
ncbi:hypothetical protein BaRGS_00016317 [Batillaria attramentaria]|uniref:Uncharacterized protein n=1 Tax=Batillaria attramentaria TaxID=370345 RepID=A0ABD0L065_9CAEN